MKRGTQALMVLLTVMALGIASFGNIGNVQAAETTGKADSEKTPEELQKEAYEKELQTVYELPVQTNELKNWPQGAGTYGDAAIVMEAGSGAILYAKNIDKAEYPASITKVLTALVAYEYADMSQKVTVTADSLSCLGAGYASIGLKEGNVITMEQAMHAMLLASANEAACAVGEAVAEGQGEEYEWFLEQMNETCKSLGGTNSQFINTNGVFEDEHYTCARDMALIGCELFRYPEFLELCQTQQYTIPASDTVEEHVFQQKHHMLIQGNKDFYQYAVGGKTGYTTEAKNTLITLADNGECQLVCVILGTYSGHTYSDTKALLDYGFQKFRKYSVENQDAGDSIDQMSEDAYVMLPEGIAFDDLDCVVTASKGGKGAGIARYYYQDMPVGSFEVTVSETYRNKGTFRPAEVDAETEAQTDGGGHNIRKVIIALGIAGVIFVAAFILLLAARTARLRRRRRRRRRGNSRKRGKRT